MKKTILQLIIPISCAVFAFQMHAAEITFSTTETNVGPGQRMEIVALLNTEGETVNAYEGIVTFPDILTIEEVREGGSLISFWLEKPYADGNRILFSGITPGGFSGEKGEIFRVIAAAASEGAGAISFEDVQVLLHDGEGTRSDLQTTDLAFSVDTAIPVTDLILAPDTTSPEPFTPVLSRDPSIFNNDYFLAFEATDADSGIDRYEVLESGEPIDDLLEGNWPTVVSPYRLEDQSLSGFAYVRAIDRAGNIRVAAVDLEKERQNLFDIITEFAPIEANLLRVIFIIAGSLLVLGLIQIIGTIFWRRFQKKQKEKLQRLAESEPENTIDLNEETKGDDDEPQSPHSTPSA